MDSIRQSPVIAVLDGSRYTRERLTTRVHDYVCRPFDYTGPHSSIRDLDGACSRCIQTPGNIEHNRISVRPPSTCPRSSPCSTSFPTISDHQRKTFSIHAAWQYYTQRSRLHSSTRSLHVFHAHTSMRLTTSMTHEMAWYHAMQYIDTHQKANSTNRLPYYQLCL
jgi:hypothetical protein